MFSVQNTTFYGFRPGCNSGCTWGVTLKRIKWLLMLIAGCFLYCKSQWLGWTSPKTCWTQQSLLCICSCSSSSVPFPPSLAASPFPAAPCTAWVAQHSRPRAPKQSHHFCCLPLREQLQRVPNFSFEINEGVVPFSTLCMTLEQLLSLRELMTHLLFSCPLHPWAEQPVLGAGCSLLSPDLQPGL